MNKDKLMELYKKYNLTKDDFFKHQHYTIITRQGIDKIQALEQMYVKYEVIKCEPNYAVFKAYAEKNGKNIETFGSAYKGDLLGFMNSAYLAKMKVKALRNKKLNLKPFNIYKYECIN